MKRLFRWLLALGVAGILGLLIWSPALRIDTVEYGPSAFVDQSQLQSLFDPFVGQSWLVSVIRTRIRSKWYRDLPAISKIHVGFKGFRKMKVGVQSKKPWIRVQSRGNPLFAAADGTLLRSVSGDYVPPHADRLPVISGISDEALSGSRLPAETFQLIRTLLKELDTRFPLQVWSIRLEPAATIVLESTDRIPVLLGSSTRLTEKLDNLKLFLRDVPTSPNITLSQIDLRASRRVIVSYGPR